MPITHSYSIQLRHSYWIKSGWQMACMLKNYQIKSINPLIPENDRPMWHIFFISISPLPFIFTWPLGNWETSASRIHCLWPEQEIHYLYVKQRAFLVRWFIYLCQHFGRGTQIRKMKAGPRILSMPIIQQLCQVLGPLLK